MNTNKKGTITELQVTLAAIQFGCIVSIPYGNNDKYDQLWDILAFIRKRGANSNAIWKIGRVVECDGLENR